MTGSTSTGTFDEPDLGPASFISHHRPFIVVWIALFVSIAGIGMVSPLLPVFAEDMGASGIWLGLAFSGFAISQIPLMPFVGGLSDRFGRKAFLWCGLLIYALAAAGYFWSPGYQELVIFRVFSGIGSAMVIPTAFAYVGELAPRGGEGRYMGLFNIALIAGFGIGPVLGGSIHDSYGMDATFVGMGMLSLAGCAIVFLLLPKRSSSSARPIFTAPSATPDPTTASFVRLLKDNGIQGIVTFQMVYGLLFGRHSARFLGYLDDHRYRHQRRPSGHCAVGATHPQWNPRISMRLAGRSHESGSSGHDWDGHGVHRHLLDLLSGQL